MIFDFKELFWVILDICIPVLVIAIGDDALFEVVSGLNFDVYSIRLMRLDAPRPNGNENRARARAHSKRQCDVAQFRRVLFRL